MKITRDKNNIEVELGLALSLLLSPIILAETIVAMIVMFPSALVLFFKGLELKEVV